MIISKSKIKKLYWKYCFDKEEVFKMLLQFLPEDMKKEITVDHMNKHSFRWETFLEHYGPFSREVVMKLSAKAFLEEKAEKKCPKCRNTNMEKISAIESTAYRDIGYMCFDCGYKDKGI